MLHMYTLPESDENWYTGWKNHADSKYDNQFAFRAIPDYEPLRASHNIFGAESEFYVKYTNILCCQIWRYVCSNLRKHEVVLIVNNRRVYM